jgi:hypothetical protein
LFSLQAYLLLLFISARSSFCEEKCNQLPGGVVDIPQVLGVGFFVALCNFDCIYHTQWNNGHDI